MENKSLQNQSPTQLEQRLKTLSGVARENLYERLELAHRLLVDADWLANFGGSLDLGEEYIAEKYFSEWFEMIQFAKLHQMFVKFPRETWVQYKCNVGAMEALYDESVEFRHESAPRRHYKDDAERAVKELRRANARLEKSSGLVSKLQSRISELEIENAALRDRIRELECEWVAS